MEIEHIAFTRAKVAVFLDGCFWHGCPEHATQPKSNAEWWRQKLDRNTARDAETTAFLVAKRWTVMRFWQDQAPIQVAENVCAAAGGQALGLKPAGVDPVLLEIADSMPPSGLSRTARLPVSVSDLPDTTACVGTTMRGRPVASSAVNAATPVAGLYETLITQRLEERIKQLDAAGWRAIDDVVGAGSAPHVLSRHIAHTVRRVLQGLDPAEQVVAANHILESIKTIKGAAEWVDVVLDGPRQLLAVAEQKAPGVYAIRPATPLSDTALITNAPEDPSLGFELRAELVL